MRSIHTHAYAHAIVKLTFIILLDSYEYDGAQLTPYILYSNDDDDGGQSVCIANLCTLHLLYVDYLLAPHVKLKVTGNLRSMVVTFLRHDENPFSVIVNHMSSLVRSQAYCLVFFKLTKCFAQCDHSIRKSVSSTLLQKGDKDKYRARKCLCYTNFTCATFTLHAVKLYKGSNINLLPRLLEV